MTLDQLITETEDKIRKPEAGIPEHVPPVGPSARPLSPSFDTQRLVDIQVDLRLIREAAIEALASVEALDWSPAQFRSWANANVPGVVFTVYHKGFACGAYRPAAGDEFYAYVCWPSVTDDSDPERFNAPTLRELAAVILAGRPEGVKEKAA